MNVDKPSTSTSGSAADTAIPTTNSDGIAAIAPPSVLRDLANDGNNGIAFVNGVQINDPREFVKSVGTGAMGQLDATTVRPALAPDQFKGITPQSTVLRIIVQLGEGYCDPMSGNGIVMWWCTDGRVLYMQWDWTHLNQPPTKLVWGQNKAF